MGECCDIFYTFFIRNMLVLPGIEPDVLCSSGVLAII